MFLLLAVNAGATDYYVKNSGGDGLTGLSDAQAWETISKVNGETFSAGDNIYFRRGDVWREQLVPDSGSSAGHITYGAYGGGAKPQLMRSVEENETSDWVDQTGNIWQNTDASLTIDVGNIILNNGDSVGIKVWGEGDVDTDLEFWYDETNDLVNLYSTSNPASRWNDVELALRGHIVNGVSKNYITIKDIDFIYGGAHGIYCSDCTYITIQDSTFKYIGGGDQDGGASEVRFGNAIEFWDSADNIIVERNVFEQSYDEAITNQGSSNSKTVSNVYVRNNIVKNCHRAYHLWLSGSSTAFNGVFIENNTFVNSGSWASVAAQRSDPDTDFVAGGTNSATITNVNIRNNIMSNPAEWMVIFDTNMTNYASINTSNNHYVTVSGNMWKWGSNIYDDTQLESLKSTESQETDSQTGAVNFIGQDNYISSSSAAKDAGINVTTVTNDFRRLPRPQDGTYDIGAYEYGQVINSNGVTLNGVTIN